MGDYPAVIFSDLIAKGEYKSNELDLKFLLNACVDSALNKPNNTTCINY